MIEDRPLNFESMKATTNYKIKTRVYRMTCDPGHGWIAVPYATLKHLRIHTKITPYSYLDHHGIAYLEEDLDAHSSDIQKYIEWRNKRNDVFKLEIDFGSMPDIMELSHNSEVWDYFAEKCLSCGQCTMVCPTCDCYNVSDVFDVTNETTGRRERTWDSCMFADYSLVAGGHNFRSSRADRLRLWYGHKLKTFGVDYGRPGCIGCGRCVDSCPVDINVLTISEALTTKEVPNQ